MARLFNHGSAYGKSPVKSRQVISRVMTDTNSDTISAVNRDNSVIYVAHREGDNRERRQAVAFISDTAVDFYSSGREHPHNNANSLQTVTIIEYDR
jgi:hypothetical protein